MAIKLGQSLRSAGSRRKRQCLEKADSDSDSTHRLDSRKERRVEGCAETEKKSTGSYSQASSSVRLYPGPAVL